MKRLRASYLISTFLLAGAVTAMSAPASHATTADLYTCPSNYVCVDTSPWTPEPDVLIPAGQSRSFPGGVKVYELTNHTKMLYCVKGSPSFALSPATFRKFDPPTTVFGVSTRGNPTGICVS